MWGERKVEDKAREVKVMADGGSWEAYEGFCHLLSVDGKPLEGADRVTADLIYDLGGPL